MADFTQQWRALTALFRDPDADGDRDGPGADTRPVRDEHERMPRVVSSGEATSRAVRAQTPLWVRALIAINQQILDVLEHALSMPQDDPIAAHYTAVGTTEQTTAPVIAGSVLRALYVGASGGTGDVTVKLHHASFPGGAKTIVSLPVPAAGTVVSLPSLLVRVPRGAYLGLTASGTITDMYLTAVVTRDRETGAFWFRGLR